MLAPLLAECLANPDDDAPRLVWADAIGGERGELVALQCGARTRERDRRQRELLGAHAMAWSGLAGLADRVQFHRGFVDAIEVDAVTWLERANEILAHAPFIRALTLTHVFKEERDVIGRERLEHICAMPELDRIVALDIVDAMPWGDTACEALAPSGVMDHIVALGLPLLTNLGLQDLGDSLANIQTLWLHDSFVHQTMVETLVARASALRELDATMPWSGLRHLVEKLPLTALCIRNASRLDVEAIGTSALAPALERLAVVSTRQVPSTELAALGAMTSLHTLELDIEVTDAHWRELVDIELPALRVLRLGAVEPRGFAAIVEKFGPQLELLDVRGTRHEVPAIAADVIGGEPIERALLSVAPRAPWLLSPHDRRRPPALPAWLVTTAGRVIDLADLGGHVSIVRVGARLEVYALVVAAAQAQIFVEDGGYVLLDAALGERRRLATGDTITFGPDAFHFTTEPIA